MGLELFGKHVVKHPEIENKLIHGLLFMIELERKGDQVGKTLIASLL